MCGGGITMKEGRRAYPVVISKEDDGFFYVEIPDFDIATQGMDCRRNGNGKGCNRSHGNRLDG